MAKLMQLINIQYNMVDIYDDMIFSYIREVLLYYYISEQTLKCR